jgi:hypothetical protein
LPIAHAATPLVRTRVVIVERGRVDVRLPPSKRPSFACLVVGPGKVQMLVTGGHSTLIAREDGSTTVATQTGHGLVSKGAGWVRLPEGAVRAYDLTTPDGVQQELPAPPERPTLSRSLLLAGRGGEAMSRVSWRASSEAGARYELSIEDVATRARRIVQSPVEHFELDGLSAGQHQLRVRTLAQNGLASGWSESVPLNVIGFELPQAARLEANGAISLLPGQRVRLIGASDLEVGYVGLDEFMPVPESLGLVQRRPITAVLRNPSTRESVRLRLEPLTVKAEIVLPHAPRRWPVGGMPLSVYLKDQKGRLVSGVRADVQVSVNLVPQRPEWQRSESEWSTAIAAPGGKGPWLVRVNVLDERGASLGMDFAEIGYEQNAAARSAR